MQEVTVKTHLDASADDVWQMVGKFNGLPEWHPMIESSELEGGGSQRRLALPDGSKIVEELKSSDDGSYTMTYGIVDSPLPVMNYTGTIKIVPDESGDGCTVFWSGHFQPQGSPGAAMQQIQDMYKAGLDNLNKMYSSE